MNKTALITSANKGIEYEIARQLGFRGFVVWLGSRDQKRGAAAVATLRSEGIDANCLLLDVSDKDSVGIAAERLQGEIGALDALVNNAGHQLRSAAA